jgi:hypothetical protein
VREREDRLPIRSPATPSKKSVKSAGSGILAAAFATAAKVGPAAIAIVNAIAATSASPPIIPVTRMVLPPKLLLPDGHLPASQGEWCKSLASSGQARESARFQG